MFDGDAYIEALDPPSVKIGGRTYVGRTLSIDEWVPIEPFCRKIQAGDGTLADAYEVVRGFCEISFSRPWYHFRWLLFWRRPVSVLIMRMPPAALKEIIADFLGSQARAMGVAPPETRDDDPESDSLQDT